MANSAPALTPLVALCYGTRPAEGLSRMDSGETRTIACSRDVHQGDPIGPAMFFLAFRPRLERIRQEFDGSISESLAFMGDVSLGLAGIAINTVQAPAFLRLELYMTSALWPTAPKH